jgi:L-alanine-DL-glutamate epimerase-like enolase superfamily enzyme
MTNTRVEAIPLRLPFKAPFKIGTTHKPKRDHIDVLIWTDTPCASWPANLSEADFADGVVDLFKSDIVRSPLRFEDGQVIVFGGPSLGVELDGDAIAAHPII